MQDLTITLIQSKIIWEDISSNMAIFDEKLNSIKEETDLIILPEMFLTGFSMNAEKLAISMNDEPVKWLMEKSVEKNADIVSSFIIKENGKYFNRLIWTKPGKQIFTYNKKHLFRMTGEHLVYSAGNKNITVELNGWKLRPFICYDLRFPMWTRNVGNIFDVAIFIANWPEPRSLHWNLLLKARAIENLSYVVGVNRVGTDGNGHSYSGDSQVVDPKGKTIFEHQNTEVIHTVKLSMTALKAYRKAFPAWMDADTI